MPDPDLLCQIQVIFCARSILSLWHSSCTRSILIFVSDPDYPYAGSRLSFYQIQIIFLSDPDFLCDRSRFTLWQIQILCARSRLFCDRPRFSLWQIQIVFVSDPDCPFIRLSLSVFQPTPQRIRPEHAHTLEKYTWQASEEDDEDGGAGKDGHSCLDPDLFLLLQSVVVRCLKLIMEKKSSGCCFTKVQELLSLYKVHQFSSHHLLKALVKWSPVLSSIIVMIVWLMWIVVFFDCLIEVIWWPAIIVWIMLRVC